MVKKIALGAVALLIVLIGAVVWMAYEPDIPRAVLEAKYAVPPSQFMEMNPAAGMTPPGSQVIYLPTRVHYRDRGPRDAPVLLLLHGSDSSLFDWEAWSNILSTPQQGGAPTAIGFQGVTEVGGPPPTSDSTGLDLKGGSYILLQLEADKGVDVRRRLAVVIAQVQTDLSSYRVISVDLPGHGLTGATPGGDYSEAAMTKFVEAFANSLGLKQFALAGNSMGGGVAARFTELHPDRVTHLIIVDGYAAGMAVGDGLPLAYRLARTPVLNEALLKLTPRLVVEEGLNKAVARKAIFTDDMIDRFWDFARMEGTRPATLQRFTQKPDTYARDHLKAIATPTLILWGADDHLVPVANAQLWAKAIPNSRLTIYPATGHLPMEELPEKSAEDVRAFLRPHLHYEIWINNGP